MLDLSEIGICDVIQWLKLLESLWQHLLYDTQVR